MLRPREFEIVGWFAVVTLIDEAAAMSMGDTPGLVALAVAFDAVVVLVNKSWSTVNFVDWIELYDLRSIAEDIHPDCS